MEEETQGEPSDPGSPGKIAVKWEQWQQ